MRMYDYNLLELKMKVIIATVLFLTLVQSIALSTGINLQGIEDSLVQTMKTDYQLIQKSFLTTTAQKSKHSLDLAQQSAKEEALFKDAHDAVIAQHKNAAKCEQHFKKVMTPKCKSQVSCASKAKFELSSCLRGANSPTTGMASEMLSKAIKMRKDRCKKEFNFVNHKAKDDEQNSHVEPSELV